MDGGGARLRQACLERASAQPTATIDRSRPVLPGGEVLGLLGRERVEDDVQGRQLEPGHFHVDRLRDVVDAFARSLCLPFRYSAASAWLAKLMSITDAGCPAAQAGSPGGLRETWMRLPSITYSTTFSRTSRTLPPASFARAGM